MASEDDIFSFVGSDVGAAPASTMRKRWTASTKRPIDLTDSSFPFALNGGRAKQVGSIPVVESVPKKKRVMAENPVTTEQWMARLQVTQAQADEIARLDQGTPEWLKSREGRLTGSNFGAAVGMNPYSSPKSLLKQMLWGEFKGNAATRWGSDHEDVARNEYVSIVMEQCNTAEERAKPDEERLVHIGVIEKGLVINPERPWMGNSPDGIVTLTYASGRQEVGLLEIKCPFKQKFYTPDPVPSYYFAQIQGTMGNLGLPWCKFVVWTPSGIQVTHVPFDEEFWNTKLLPGLTTFYFNFYLPRALDKENGVLLQGETEAPPLDLSPIDLTVESGAGTAETSTPSGPTPAP